MKYNKTQKRFDIGLGLYFQIVEHNGKLRVISNVPAINMQDLDSITMAAAICEVKAKLIDLRESLNYGNELQKFIKENKIKELL